jgi:Lrp/AsnC family transcriptional regulator for asnA, asnC and gidA
MSAHDEHQRLDATDRKLIGLLMADGRRSYASLAPEVGLSQAATRVRVQRLLSDRIIDVNARVDPTVLGHGVFAFTVLTVRGPLEQTAARIAEIPEAVFLVKTSGRWDLLVEIRTIDNAALIDVLDRVRGIDAVTDAETLVVLRYAKQDWATSGLISDVEKPITAPPQWPASNTVDETDLKLIHGLVADGRASFTELASTVGLSHAAVRDRVL